MRTPGVLAIASILAGSVSARAETTVEIRPSVDRTQPAPPTVAPGRIKIGFVDGTVSLDRVRLELRVEPHAVVGKLVLAYSSPATPKNIVVPLEVPRGTAMDRLVVTTGEPTPTRTQWSARQRQSGFIGPTPRPVRSQLRLVASVHESVRARSLYTDVVYQHRDPALLEWQGSDDDTDKLQLEVFPIGQRSPGVVELGFELPRMQELVIDPDGQLVDRVDVVVIDRKIDRQPRTSKSAWVSKPLAIEIGDHVRPGHLEPRASKVSSSHSLVALPPPDPNRHRRVPIIVCGIPHRQVVQSPMSARGIRKIVRAAQPRLQHCFMKTAQANPALAGTANFHFTIAGGKTTDISIDGDLDHPEIISCMKSEVATWQFPHAEGVEDRTQINWPMHFSAR